jgi:UDP-N-acetylmuramoyl-L-alanyl-D-glutamate--2,6-diaminopimelate ligase
MGHKMPSNFKKNLAGFDPGVFTAKVEVGGISINSEQVKNGDLFIALPGIKTHGSKFLQKAINNGAAAVLSDISLACSIPSFVHSTPRELVGPLSAWFFESPFDQLKAVGITGTNGKTTTADLIKQLWDLNDLSTGLIGTLGVKVKNTTSVGTHTTPEANELQQIAALMVDQGVSNLVMEVSSHAIEQFRIKGAKFQVVGFTNLTQDHLDYHGNMENYFAAKSKLFTQEYAERAIINIDDTYGRKLTQNIKLPFQTISRSDNESDWYYSNISLTNTGYKVMINSNFGNRIEGEIGIKGDFNLDNLLLAVAISSSMGLTDQQIASHLIKLKPVEGRLEQISLGQQFYAFVDYAHTPDAVTRVLESVRKFTKGRIIAVLGCGGERDTAKRPLMGEAIYSHSDFAIFTSDNPRGEEPNQILKDMTAGLKIADKGIIIENRKAAIEHACQIASKDDCIMILGKGHEIGQEINGIRHPFDDRVELSDAIKKVIK